MQTKQMASIALCVIGAIDYLGDGTILTRVMLHSVVAGNKKCDVFSRQKKCRWPLGGAGRWWRNYFQGLPNRACGGYKYKTEATGYLSHVQRTDVGHPVDYNGTDYRAKVPLSQAIMMLPLTKKLLNLQECDEGHANGQNLISDRLADSKETYVGVEVCVPPMSSDGRAPIKMTGGCALSPGVYRLHVWWVRP